MVDAVNLPILLNAQAFLARKRSDTPSCVALDLDLRGNSGPTLQDMLNATRAPSRAWPI
jgi:FixJ family two-component response regulator